MKTKFIVCLGTSPDDILASMSEPDYDGYPDDDSLEHTRSFTSEKKARDYFDKSVNGRTNMQVHLLKVEMVSSECGHLFDKKPAVKPSVETPRRTRATQPSASD